MSFAGLLCIVLSVSCSLGRKHNDRAAADSSADREAVEKVVTDTVEAANNGDIEVVLSYFAEDAVLLPPEEVPVFGKKLIRPRFQELFDNARVTLFFTLEETVLSGGWAFARGYTGGRAEPKDRGSLRLIDNDQCLVILLKDSTGSWKIARLMWSPMYPRKSVFE